MNRKIPFILFHCASERSEQRDFIGSGKVFLLFDYYYIFFYQLLLPEYVLIIENKICGFIYKLADLINYHVEWLHLFVGKNKKITLFAMVTLKKYIRRFTQL